MKTRYIAYSFTKNRLELKLWVGTEDEQSFKVHAIKGNNPYVVAYGTKVYLTQEETKDGLYLLEEANKHKNLTI